MSVGAPVRDRSGAAVAAISVAGPSERMEHDLDLITRAVVEAATIASKRLNAPSGAGAAA